MLVLESQFPRRAFGHTPEEIGRLIAGHTYRRTVGASIDFDAPEEWMEGASAVLESRERRAPLYPESADAACVRDLDDALKIHGQALELTQGTARPMLWTWDPSACSGQGGERLPCGSA